MEALHTKCRSSHTPTLLGGDGLLRGVSISCQYLQTHIDLGASTDRIPVGGHIRKAWYKYLSTVLQVLTAGVSKAMKNDWRTMMKNYNMRCRITSSRTIEHTKPVRVNEGVADPLNTVACQQDGDTGEKSEQEAEGNQISLHGSSGC